MGKLFIKFIIGNLLAIRCYMQPGLAHLGPEYDFDNLVDIKSIPQEDNWDWKKLNFISYAVNCVEGVKHCIEATECNITTLSHSGIYI